MFHRKLRGWPGSDRAPHEDDIVDAHLALREQVRQGRAGVLVHASLIRSARTAGAISAVVREQEIGTEIMQGFHLALWASRLLQNITIAVKHQQNFI